MAASLELAWSALPLPSDYCRGWWLGSLAALSTLYYATSHLSGFSGLNAFEKAWPEEKRQKRALLKTKQRSWILTGTAALVMTLGSIPFVSDLLWSGLDVAAIERREGLSQALSCFFMAYLAVDLVLGAIHYPSQVSLLTGWVHHTAYQVLLFFILREGSAHVFAMAAVMELPTFVLASAFIWPETRSDELFIGLFFATRIAFHAVLGALFSSAYGISRGTSRFDPATGAPLASYLPLIGLTLAAPLHLMWFTSSVRGYLRRRKTAPPSPLLKSVRTAVRPQLLRMASSFSSLPPSSFTLATSIASLGAGSFSPPFGASTPSFSASLSGSLADKDVDALDLDGEMQPAPSALRARLELELASFFAEWRRRDESDVLKALSPLGQVRMRAGRRGDALRNRLRSQFAQAPIAGY